MRDPSKTPRDRKERNQADITRGSGVRVALKEAARACPRARTSQVGPVVFEKAMGFLETGLRETGNGAYAFVALSFAKSSNYHVPDWALQYLWDAYVKWDSGQIKTMDEGLGLKRQKGKHRDSQRFDAWQIPVYTKVEARRGNGEPLDRLLFESVAEECVASGAPKFKGTKASKLYYDHVKKYKKTQSK